MQKHRKKINPCFASTKSALKAWRNFSKQHDKSAQWLYLAGVRPRPAACCWATAAVFCTICASAAAAAAAAVVPAAGFGAPPLGALVTGSVRDSDRDVSQTHAHVAKGG